MILTDENNFDANTWSKPDVNIKVVLTFLKIILTLSNFAFNGMNYLHKKDCAMGTKCASSHANIFMGWFEEKFIFPLLTKLSNFYLRFIDDIFLVWNGTKTEVDNFLKKIKECHPSIKFEYEMSQTEINFLDTTVFKANNKLRTKVHVKPTDKVIYTVNQNILIPLRKVLPIARH